VWVNPWADIPFPLHIPKTQKGTQKWAKILQSPLRLAFHIRQAVEVPKMVKYDQVLPKLGQGPTCPQHSPVTRPESLWSEKFCLEHLDLGLSFFDLLQCYDLLLNELMDECIIDWPF
jgi:hypothetical protein